MTLRPEIGSKDLVAQNDHVHASGPLKQPEPVRIWRLPKFIGWSRLEELQSIGKLRLSLRQKEFLTTHPAEHATHALITIPVKPEDEHQYNVGSGTFYMDDDDVYPPSPGLEPVYPRAAPSPSPPPQLIRDRPAEQDDFVTGWLTRLLREAEEQYPSLASTSESRLEKSLQPKDHLPHMYTIPDTKSNQRKTWRKIQPTRPTQGDWVLIREMDPNRPDIAQQVSQQALNSESDSDDDDDEMFEQQPEGRHTTSHHAFHTIIATTESTVEPMAHDDVAADGSSTSDVSVRSTARFPLRKRRARRSSDSGSHHSFYKRRRCSTDVIRSSSDAQISDSAATILSAASGPNLSLTTSAETALSSTSPDSQNTNGEACCFTLLNRDSFAPFPCTYCTLEFATRGQLT
jgi:hypothetical protein